MRMTTTRVVAALLVGAAALLAGGRTSSAQELEYVLSPEGGGFDDPFPVGQHNGARGLAGPFDLDGDGRVEILVAQNSGAGGRVHVIENQGIDTWTLVYSTAVIDSSVSSFNARYATGADLDGDGRGEIVYVAGNDYRSDDPALTFGVYVWEYDGQGFDDYGDYPAAVGNLFELDGLGPGSGYAQRLHATDLDGDGRQELLVPISGVADEHDVFYIVSVNGAFETGQAASATATWTIESRVNPHDDGLGGGSPVDLLPADLNGDGSMDLSYHSWLNFNVFNGTVGGFDQVVLPDPSAAGSFLHATTDDEVALFGGVAADIDGDGDEEVFYPNYTTENIAVLDYGADQDVLSVTTSELSVNAIQNAGAGGIAAGDLDGDGRLDLIVGDGDGYFASSFRNGEPSSFLRLVRYLGGDPKEPASYAVHHLDTSHPIDTTGFHTVYTDSLGVTSSYKVTARSKQGATGLGTDPFFTTSVAFLGDADGDGLNEVALAFQGVDDSLWVIDQIWNADSSKWELSVRDTVASPARPFVRIYEIPQSFNVARQAESDLPRQFELHPNYPNPFNPSTTIRFTLRTPAEVTVRVYDATGRTVATLVPSRAYAAGTHEIVWDGRAANGRAVSSGTYFCALEANGRRLVRPMTVVK